MDNRSVDVIIPALNEEASIGKVIKDLPKELIREVIVVDNGSSDLTANKAKEAGATVLSQPIRGYGRACLTGMEYLEKKDVPYAVLFLDGDYSDYPEESKDILKPVLKGTHDFVLGSRALGKSEKGSMTSVQRFGNWLATGLIKKIHNGEFTDLGPFRAITWKALMDLEMRDKNYGWTIEMQIKAIKNKLRVKEVPVKYRNRIGKSKVSGTFQGSIKAGFKILFTLTKHSVL